MPTIRRTRTLAAPTAAVWKTASDPHHLPRWWPRVVRVEGVDSRGFTEVLLSKRGRPVRADFRVAGGQNGRSVTWVQELEGTPFAGIFDHAEKVISLEPLDGGAATALTLEITQRMRGLARFGGMLVRRAGKRQLDMALDALEGLLVDAPG